MTDPFQVLGISPNASDDEIKKAYRAKCKEYHPDLHPNDPTAEEKFKEVQTAYSQVMDIKQGKASYGGYGSSAGGYSGYSHQGGPQYRTYTDPFGFGGFGFGFDPFRGQAGYARQESTEMQAAGNFIRSGHYQEALRVLNSIPDLQRQGRWYYYNALANSGLGNRVNALESIRQALNFEPDNPEYRQLLSQLQNNMYGYQTQYRQYSSPVMGFGSGNFCLQMLILNMLCNCFCGGCGMGGFYR